MYESKDKFARYFIDQAKRIPKTRENELRGWLEEIRVEVFQNRDNFDYHQLTGDPFSSVQGNVYQISAKSISAILAYYENDDEIFWLDNHNSNIDLEHFFFREKFLDWLPAEVNKVAQVFMETKLNYLGMPKLIQDVSEITKNKDNFFEFRRRKFNSIEELQKLQNLIDRLHNPSVSLINGIFHLDFCLWTKILGRIIKIQSTIDSEGHIKYSGEQLAQEIGNWHVPK